MKNRRPVRAMPLPRSLATVPAEDSPVLDNGHKAPGRPQESILCFPAFRMDPDQGFAPGRFCGFRTDAMEMVGRLFPAGVLLGDFHPRTADLEGDDRLKQVIVGVVPYHRASRQVWTYRRGGSEGRLKGKLSCILGGHVNLQDLILARYRPDPPRSEIGQQDLMDILWAGAIREMGEEAGDWQGNWKKDRSDCRLILEGTVNEESTLLDRVHFGFIYRLEIQDWNVPVKVAEDVGAAHTWCDVAPLGREDGPDSDVENWTWHICRHLAAKSVVRSMT